MITQFLLWLLGELVCSSKDGSLSLTRLTSATAHFLAAIFFVYHNLFYPFNEWLWTVYLGFATGHAIYDKTLMMTKAKPAAEAQPT